ncbi:MAG: DNA repair protein RecN, partial [Pseudomonadales bacterium]
THLAVNNYTTVKKLELDCKPGMTVITGETGAGKSVMLDALSLVIGGRADSKTVRHSAERADIHAIFDVSQLNDVKEWLTTRDLQQGDDCLLRRVITREGRSRAYINGQPVPVQDLKQLGHSLIELHGQHEHQSLLKKETHRQLLDAFAGEGKLSQSVTEVYQQWRQAQRHWNKLQSAADENSAQAQLLQYQVAEFDELGIGDDEFAELEQEQKQLSSGEDLLAACQQSLALCETDESLNLLTACSQLQQLMAPFAAHDPALHEVSDLMSNASIQIQEAAYALQTRIDDVDLSPEHLQAVEARLSQLYAIARKHHVAPAELVETSRKLHAEYEQLKSSDTQLEDLQAEIDLHAHRYQKLAQELSQKRMTAASALTGKINQQLKKLAMTGCQFDIQLTPLADSNFSAHGLESVEFLISTIPGQAPQALNRVASGGELSRISLAIQVVTASKKTIPTLVFDEVDVGISGGVAEVVGTLLRQLGKHSQVLCVTHLAQVAAKGHNHLGVRKFTRRKQVATELSILQDDAKVEEIARMLGGIAITEQSRAHATEMLMARH